MIRKFECKDCKKRFDADEQDFVICPYCQSDNVDLYKRHLPYWLPLSIAGGTIAVILTIWFLQTHSDPPKPSISGIEIDSGEQRSFGEPDNRDIGNVNSITPSLSIAEKDYNADDETYKCRISISNPPKQSWKVVIRTIEGRLVAESEDGRFDEVPYSTNDGTYMITLVDKSSGSSLCEERAFPDFPKLDIVINPWNESDLQMALNSDEPLVDNPNVANPHTVIVVNKPPGDSSPTNSLRDVQLLINQCHLTAKVEKVEYDNMNKICTINIKIDYPDDWLQEDDY